jgi:hypothetical protein
MSEELLGFTRQESSSGRFERAFQDLLARLSNGDIFLFIADRFDESVVLLHYILTQLYHPRVHIDYDDLVYVHLKTQAIKDQQLKAEDEQLLRALQSHDQLLYEHANHAFDRYIASYEQYTNRSFASDVISYQQHRRSILDTCSALMNSSSSSSTSSNHQRSRCQEINHDNKDLIALAWKSKQTAM